MKHEYKVGVVLSESAKIKSPAAPHSGENAISHFQLTKNLIISETVHDGRILTIKP